MSYDSVLKFLLDEYINPILNGLFDTQINEPVERLNIELNVEPIRPELFLLAVLAKIEQPEAIALVNCLIKKRFGEIDNNLIAKIK